MEYKNFKIEGDGTFGMKVIKTIGAGSIPEALKGSFSKVNIAMQAIDFYLAEKQEKLDAIIPRVKKVKLYPREVVENAPEGESGD